MDISERILRKLRREIRQSNQVLSKREIGYLERIRSANMTSLTNSTGSTFTLHLTEENAPKLQVKGELLSDTKAFLTQFTDFPKGGV